MPSPEILLAFALVAVYVIDSIQFLAIGEVVVRTRGSTPRSLAFGSSFELGGRRPFVPNPLTPYQPDFRLQWDLSGAATADIQHVSEQMRSHLRAIRAIGWAATLSGLLVVVMAPIALCLGQQVIFLASVAASWLVSATACIVLIGRRREFELGTAQLASLVFVALVCLPCSANLARATTLQRKWLLAAGDLPLLGFTGADLQALRRRVIDALTGAKRFVEEDSESSSMIDAQLRRLQADTP